MHKNDDEKHETSDKQKIPLGHVIKGKSDPILTALFQGPFHCHYLFKYTCMNFCIFFKYCYDIFSNNIQIS